MKNYASRVLFVREASSDSNCAIMQLFFVFSVGNDLDLGAEAFGRDFADSASFGPDQLGNVIVGDQHFNALVVVHVQAFLQFVDSADYQSDGCLDVFQLSLDFLIRKPVRGRGC